MAVVISFNVSVQKSLLPPPPSYRRKWDIIQGYNSSAISCLPAHCDMAPPHICASLFSRSVKWLRPISVLPFSADTWCGPAPITVLFHPADHWRGSAPSTCCFIQLILKMAQPHRRAASSSRCVIWHHRTAPSSWSLTWLRPIAVLLHPADPWHGSALLPCYFIQLIRDMAAPHRHGVPSSWSLTWLRPTTVLFIQLIRN